jgi:hypothetical protein
VTFKGQLPFTALYTRQLFASVFGKKRLGSQYIQDWLCKNPEQVTLIKILDTRHCSHTGHIWPLKGKKGFRAWKKLNDIQSRIYCYWSFFLQWTNCVSGPCKFWRNKVSKKENKMSNWLNSDFDFFKFKDSNRTGKYHAYGSTYGIPFLQQVRRGGNRR